MESDKVTARRSIYIVVASGLVGAVVTWLILAQLPGREKRPETSGSPRISVKPQEPSPGREESSAFEEARRLSDDLAGVEALIDRLEAGRRDSGEEPAGERIASGDKATSRLGEELAALEGLLAEVRAGPSENPTGSPARPRNRDDSWKKGKCDELRSDLLRLLGEYDGETDAVRRARTLSKIARSHISFGSLGGGDEFLPAIRAIIESATSVEERRKAVIALHSVQGQGVADLLESLLSSPDPGIRFYATEGLGWIRGAQSEKAMELLVQALGDEDPGVRRIAAITMATAASGTSRVEPLLARLRLEQDRGAATGIILAVLRLDSKTGGDRLLPVLEECDPIVREVGNGILEKPR